VFLEKTLRSGAPQEKSYNEIVEHLNPPTADWFKEHPGSGLVDRRTRLQMDCAFRSLVHYMTVICESIDFQL
jgi:hypothetical protein